MKNLRKFLEENYPDEEFLMADGFDSAFIGINRGFNGGQLVYDREKCIKVFMKRDKMSWEEAEEFFEYNPVRACAYYENPPIFVEVLK